MSEDNGEFRGATKAEIRFIKDQLAQLRSDLKEIGTVLDSLRDFKTKVLTYAGLAAAVATFSIQYRLERVQ